MLLKFMKPAKATGATGGIDYLLDPDRHQGVEPVLLSGDVETTRQLLLASGSTNPYTTGVLSFAEEESDISDELKEYLMSSFEQTLLCGLEKNQYDICWIEHRDKDRLELNFHIVNTELQTNKQLVPYLHQFDKKRMNAWKSLQNDLHNLANPDAPERKRTLKLGKSQYQEVKKEIHNYLENLWISGDINNRKELIEELKNIDEITITKKTKKSISIQVDGMNKPMRLAGELYNDNVGTCEKFIESKEDRQRKFDEAREKRISENTATIKEEIQKLSRTRREKYRKPEQEKQIQNELSSRIVSDYIATTNSNNNVSVNVQNNIREVREKLSRMRRSESDKEQTSILPTEIKQELKQEEREKENEQREHRSDRTFATSIRAITVAVRAAIQRARSAFNEGRAAHSEREHERAERIREQIQRHSKKQRLEQNRVSSDRSAERKSMQNVRVLQTKRGTRREDLEL